MYTKDDSDKAGFRIEITCNVQDINMKDMSPVIYPYKLNLKYMYYKHFTITSSGHYSL